MVDRIDTHSEDTPETDNDNIKSDMQGFTFEANICIYPETSDNKSDYQTIIEKCGKSQELDQNIWKLKQDVIKTHEYKHTNISKIELLQNNMKITFPQEKIGEDRESLHIDYNDIINIKLLDRKRIGSTMLLYDSTYLRLILDSSKNNQDDRELHYIYLIGQHQGRIDRPKANTTDIQYEVVHEPDVSKKMLKKAGQFLTGKCENLEQDMAVLIDWIEWNGMLRIQGVKEGDKRITGSISGETQSSGVSRGVQVGPFSKSQSKSTGSVEADVGGKIEDNTFESDIKFFQVDKDGIYIDSDPILDLPYSEIDRVLERDKGVQVEIGDTTYSLTGRSIFVNGRVRPKSLDRDISAVCSFIQEKVEKSQDSTPKSKPESGVDSQTPAEKIQDLKQLLDDGIISEDEFEAKKNELLDEF